MRWASALSQERNLDRAFNELVSCITRQFGTDADSVTNQTKSSKNAPDDDEVGALADLVVVFVGSHHAHRYSDIPNLIAENYPNAVILGCSGGGILGDGSEVERAPAISIAVAQLPGVDLYPFHVGPANVPAPGPDYVNQWAHLIGTTPDEDPAFLIFADPYSTNPNGLLSSLDLIYPTSPKVGGMVSGGSIPGTHALFVNDMVLNHGAAGLAMTGNLVMHTIVAQGCRPVGTPMFVTRAGYDKIYELDQKPPTVALADLYKSLPTRDRTLFRESLFVGLVIDDDQHSYDQGDFLIRNIIGVTHEPDALQVGAVVAVNQVVQFHLRDAVTSAQDLTRLLKRYHEKHDVETLAGALLFSCLGRGSELYGCADHDSRVFRDTLGCAPIAGFFCNGEIGPVQGRTFLHGYTSSFALFKPKRYAH